MNKDETVPVYHFGRFEIQAGERRLLADGQPVAVGPRAFDLLIALVEGAGRLLTKDELLKLVWPKLVVEENNLQVQVSALRKLLGPAAIATVPRRGYRFALRLEPTSEGSSRSAVARAHNLPQPLTSFIGHDDDAAEYVRLLEQIRLVTLTGVGGCGKTRLAIKLAQMLLPSFPDGVWFVSLARLGDPARVAPTVAATLGVRKVSDKVIIDTLCERLANLRMLIVLDSCEHIILACAQLVERLLSTTHELRILATSREGLGVPGERTPTVRSLTLPTEGAVHTIATLRESEAVQLFVDRARGSDAQFQLNDESAVAVVDICRRLDGIPLAIELAAARLKMLSVEEIEAKLDDRFRLLTGGSRTALARHQTLRATMQWSYDHLTPGEQRLYGLLSVFAGSWTLEGAVHVVGGDANEFEVLDLLTHLADKSLVISQHIEGDATRYSMLETVRQDALERLNMAGEADAARARHLDYYLSLAEQAEPKLAGPEQGKLGLRLGREQENLLLAHGTCDHAEGGAQQGLRLVYALRRYFIACGLLELGQRLIAEALVRRAAMERNVARARALIAACLLNHLLGRYAVAREHAEESLAIAREIRDETMTARALCRLGDAVSACGDLTAAQAYYQESLALGRELENAVGIGYALFGLAEVDSAKGELEQAEALYGQALAIARERNAPDNIGGILLSLSRVSIARGNREDARRMLREALAVAKECSSRWLGAVALEVSSEFSASVNEWARAARLDGAADAARSRAGLEREPRNEQIHLPFTAQARDALGDSAYRELNDAGHALSLDAALAEARTWLDAAAAC